MSSFGERGRNGSAADANGSGRWWALAALSLSGLLVGLDSTVLHVALPELSTSLHATTSQLQWFADAFTLVVGLVMLPAANLGDRYGRKRLLQALTPRPASPSG